MQWIVLLAAGILEVTWAVAMKFSEGFTVLLPSIVTGAAYILSAVFLAMALHRLPLGTAYAMWTGFGIIGTTVFGIILFGEALSPMKILFICMIIGGIAGLKLLS